MDPLSSSYLHRGRTASEREIRDLSTSKEVAAVLEGWPLCSFSTSESPPWKRGIATSDFIFMIMRR